MLFGTVVGQVWATRKDPALVGMTFLVVRETDLDGTPTDTFVVAADAVGAGVGEAVLVAQGSSGRQTALTQGKPVDAVVMAIVDRVDVDAALRKPAAARRQIA
jgi:microcompartment protein CcmK/EutM